MKFQIVQRDQCLPSAGSDSVYLRIDYWNDFSFVTMFYVSYHDKSGKLHNIGNVKIGFIGQTTDVSTYEKLPASFDAVGVEFFSLGQDIDYYRHVAELPDGVGKTILSALRDIVTLPNLISEIQGEPVFGISLLRGTSLSVIKGQYSRVLEGKPELTNYKFRFIRPETDKLGTVDVKFNVEVASTPSTNIHALIGRNGVGKTTLLNGMIEAIVRPQDSSAKFFDVSGWKESEISADYFSSLVSVSFSAFDPFTPPREQPDAAKGTCYFYIGLKDPGNEGVHRAPSDLQQDCVRSLISCFCDGKKTSRWRDAINKLGSDENFASMNLAILEEIYIDVRASLSRAVQHDSGEFRNVYHERVASFLSDMSSGHAIVLLTITRLVATVEEKTLVVLDEPESHLHPPLLSAFIRALSDLLHDRNGVAIIATHSPVVLQEIPRSCVWKIYRSGKSIIVDRPKIETFGENVGLLTSEVFNLEVERSGFHDLLAKSVESGLTYDEILVEYNGQLGFEGRAILSALIANRDRR